MVPYLLAIAGLALILVLAGIAAEAWELWDQRSAARKRQNDPRTWPWR